MPNFHTHWLVALQVIDRLPAEYGFLVDGRDTYVQSSVDLGKAVREHVQGILDRADLDGASKLQETIKTKVAKWEREIGAKEDAICFSAYLLGACGPDFWMLPGDNTSGFKPDMGEHHFDLGHYNRSHRQFEISARALRGTMAGLQARVEKSYFLGMATHIGSDLVLHQLVNVYAGAYNLLKKDKGAPAGIWSNEQGIEYLSPDLPAPPQPAPEGNWAQRAWGTVANTGKRAGHHVGENVGKAGADTLPIWTTHNKVEHYWDTWVRHRWLGDFATVWDRDVEAKGFPELKLPLCDTLRRDLLGRTGAVAGMGNTVGHYGTDAWRSVGRAVPFVDHSENRRAAVLDRVDYALGSVETRWLLEKPLAFPWLFCDSVLDGKCSPFIYKRVVDKKTGAYPDDEYPLNLTFACAKVEAESPQMDEPLLAKPANDEAKVAPSPTAGKSEKKKLQVFSTERNHAIPASSWNYLAFIMAPNLERLRKFGDDKFYEREAFPPFVTSAVSAARLFANDLAHAYAAKKGAALGKLGQFWNLDTGLGLQVVKIPSPERHQVVTRIDWVHVLGAAGVGQGISWARAMPPPYAKGMPPAAEPYPLAAWKQDDRAFKIYRSPGFPKLKAVVEEEGVIEARKYFSRLRLAQPVGAVATAPIFRRVEDEKVRGDDVEFDEALFADDGPCAVGGKHHLPTGKCLKAETSDVEHRLDLVVRVPIARLGAEPGGVAMFLLGDAKGDGVQGPEVEVEDGKNGTATAWLRHRSRILDRGYVLRKGDALDPFGLASFSARVIVNLNGADGKPKARAVKAGDWNNVVPWEKHKAHYGRNFAIATARTHTLRGVSGKPPFDFDPTKDYECLEGLGLTEHCFFTLYPLVRIGGKWIDAFSKDEVTLEAFKELKKVDAINFVKIILFYVIDGGGALQLGWCYIDGMRRRVH